jgi:Mg-chelatase subunit ChlD
VADIGASSEETSTAIDEKGIGSHLSPLKNQNQDFNSMGEYGKNIWNKLSNLNMVHSETGKNGKYRLMLDTKSENTRKLVSRVIGEKLPKDRGLTDTKFRYQAGKRALSLSSSQTGRIIGSKPFKDSPKNIHIMATIMNALRHQKRRKLRDSTKKIEISIADVHEKVYCARVSATIIFVLDLSESIMNVINTVSASVNWLSRQAYLYRDRVGLVVLQKTQATVIQAPTSNLNLVKRKLQELQVSGSTPLPSGIQKALDLIRIDRIRSNNETIPMIVLITDGATNIPLLKDPVTGVRRDKPISALGIDLAIKISINDCLSLGQQIKKDKISLVIFSTNVQGMNLLKKYPGRGQQNPSQLLDTLMKTTDFFQGKQFIQLWSYTLLKTIQNITGGHLFFLTKEYTDNNFETLRIARSRILTSING